jgi:hypothetical protein
VEEEVAPDAAQDLFDGMLHARRVRAAAHRPCLQMHLLIGVCHGSISQTFTVHAMHS